MHRDRLALNTRRQFLSKSLGALGSFWMATQAPAAQAGAGDPTGNSAPFAPRAAHLPAKAKSVIFLHMAGAPSQFELFEYKPELARLHGSECPREFLEGKRFAFIRGTPTLLGPQYPFAQHGQSGAWLSDRLPHFSRVVDDVCFLRTMQTDQFNHAPAQLLVHTGDQRFGYSSMGSWVTYGLGSANQNLPGFVVLLSGGKRPDAGTSIWSAGFLPSVYQGVQCRSSGEPVLFLDNPRGTTQTTRRAVIDAISELNRATFETYQDPETLTRISQYEMAYRMQMAATDAMDIQREPAHVHELYGAVPGRESLANNCLLARRLVERGVRFVQLFDWGWDSHGSKESESLNLGFKQKCLDMDRPVAALLADLKQRGLLDETLVVWAGEFGRTPMRENRGGVEMAFVGRDHHPHAFTLWMAGGGVRAGYSHGQTDDFGYFPTQDAVNVRDFHATLLRLCGLEHTQLTFPFQGLDQKLTGVKPARVIAEVIA